MSNFLIKFSETMITIVNKTVILDDESLNFLLQKDMSPILIGRMGRLK